MSLYIFAQICICEHMNINAKKVTVQCLHSNSYQGFHQMSIDQCPPPSLWQHSINGILIIIQIEHLNLFNDTLLEVKCNCFIDWSQLRVLRSAGCDQKDQCREGSRLGCATDQMQNSIYDLCKIQHCASSMFWRMHCALCNVWICCKFCSK